MGTQIHATGVLVSYRESLNEKRLLAPLLARYALLPVGPSGVHPAINLGGDTHIPQRCLRAIGSEEGSPNSYELPLELSKMQSCDL